MIKSSFPKLYPLCAVRCGVTVKEKIMNEEKMKILKMLEEKKISSTEAMQLLESLEKIDSKAQGVGGGKGRTLKIRVYKEDSSEPKVNVNVPLVWSKFLTPFIGVKIKEELEAKGYPVDLEKIQEALESGEIGKIIEVNNDKNRVEIYIE